MLHRLNLFLFLILLILGGGVGGYLIYDDQQTQNLVVAAGSRSSEGFQLVQAIAEVVNRHHPKIRLEVIETAGSLDNSRLMDKGYADLATFQADGGSSARAHLIANLYPDAFQLIVRRSAQIHTVADLKGKLIALPSKGSAQFTSFWFLARHYGINENNIRPRPRRIPSAAHVATDRQYRHWPYSLPDRGWRAEPRGTTVLRQFAVRHLPRPQRQPDQLR